MNCPTVDAKQCTRDAEADRILAARVLHRFTPKRQRLRVDRSASSCNNGLGTSTSDLTGLGVGWEQMLLERLL